MRAGVLHLPAGIAGDMLLGALVDAEVPFEVLQEAVAAVSAGRLALKAETVQRAGIRGTRIHVLLDGAEHSELGGPGPSPAESGPSPEHSHPPDHEHEHEHSHEHEQPHRAYRDIRDAIAGAGLAPAVAESAQAVFRVLAEAEGRQHDVDPDSVHFHEVGAWDALADVVGAAAGLAWLQLDMLYHGTIAVGGGVVRAAHGELPVPAPATAHLLRGRSCRYEEGAGELTTPTGAAILAALAKPLPTAFTGSTVRIGYGAGRADPPGRPNLTRLTILQTETQPELQRVAVVETALDDTTPEAAGFALETLLREGALDVTLTPLVMKKSRPGFLLRVVAPSGRGPEFAERVTALTSSLGVRFREDRRIALDRRVDRVRLPDGEVRVKVALQPDGTERPQPEFEDVASVARARGVALDQVLREVQQRWASGR